MKPATHMMHFTDFYKTGHVAQYPAGTNLVYSNFTARTSRIEGIDHVVIFGLQYLIKKYLLNEFNEHFFGKRKEDVVAAYKRRMDAALGVGVVDPAHIGALHDLGYLPIEIKALPEGTLCPIKVPFMTIVNTHPDFYWVTNYLETLISSTLWFPITSATLAHEFKQLLKDYAALTSDMQGFVRFQGHDFALRGHTSLESASISGAAHLLSFVGTDTVPAIDFLEGYYAPPQILPAHEQEYWDIIGCSVPATEHSVMAIGNKEGEKDTFIRLITEVYPRGIVSIVSDTWDFWNTLDVIVRELKSMIMARDGKVVIRPDSGDPVLILAGDPDAPVGSPQFKGAVELLWEIFGGETNTKGYKQLDQHIGLIYGDSITVDRCRSINERLMKKGFASTNVVYGLGSYFYQYVTRDTFGFAIKATYGEVNGVGREIFKDPKTDDGTKRSARGMVAVYKDGNGELVLQDGLTPETLDEAADQLKTIFKNGDTSMAPRTDAVTIRRLLANGGGM